MQPVLRPARMCDAKKIHGLLMECSAEGLLLPRSLSNLYGQIRDFRILETGGGEFIGCAALAVICWRTINMRAWCRRTDFTYCIGGIRVIALKWL